MHPYGPLSESSRRMAPEEMPRRCCMASSCTRGTLSQSAAGASEYRHCMHICLQQCKCFVQRMVRKMCEGEDRHYIGRPPETVTYPGTLRRTETPFFSFCLWTEKKKKAMSFPFFVTDVVVRFDSDLRCGPRVGSRGTRYDTCIKEMVKFEATNGRPKKWPCNKNSSACVDKADLSSLDQIFKTYPKLAQFRYKPVWSGH